jgi:hypothetical protein
MAVTSVPSSATSVALLASSSRRGGAIENTDANVLYVILDSAAATTSLFTVSLAEGDYYELPPGYDGEVRGIWAADGAGAAKVTEW